MILGIIGGIVGAALFIATLIAAYITLQGGAE
jgi:hypothetical protein